MYVHTFCVLEAFSYLPFALISQIALYEWFLEEELLSGKGVFLHRIA